MTCAYGILYAVYGSIISGNRFQYLITWHSVSVVCCAEIPPVPKCPRIIVNCSTVVTAIYDKPSSGDVDVGLTCRIKYREKGSTEWHVKRDDTCSSSSQVITNLEPGVLYELDLFVAYLGTPRGSSCKPRVFFQSKHRPIVVKYFAFVCLCVVN